VPHVRPKRTPDFLSELAGVGELQAAFLMKAAHAVLVVPRAGKSGYMGRKRIFQMLSTPMHQDLLLLARSLFCPAIAAALKGAAPHKAR